MLEPYALKGACTVLRGREVSNDLLLPDKCVVDGRMVGIESPLAALDIREAARIAR
jgi:hypothetical protein